MDESGVTDAAYGPAGLIQAGQAFHKRDRNSLAEAYRDLDRALNILKVADYELWIHWHRPYLSGISGSSILTEWRKRFERGNRDVKGAMESGASRYVRSTPLGSCIVVCMYAGPGAWNHTDDLPTDRMNSSLLIRSLYSILYEDAQRSWPGKMGNYVYVRPSAM